MAEILAYRQAWGFILAKFMSDPIWWFYIFWLPSYLKQGRGFTLQEIGLFAWGFLFLFQVWEAWRGGGFRVSSLNEAGP